MFDQFSSNKNSDRAFLEGRVAEAKSINKSLHFLEQVVIAIQTQQHRENGFVPFRNSLMTFLLKE